MFVMKKRLLMQINEYLMSFESIQILENCQNSAFCGTLELKSI